MNYLLGDEALQYYLLGPQKSPTPDELKFRDWAKTLSAQDYHFASRISVAMVHAAVERIANAAKRESTRQSIDSKLVTFKDSLLEVDETVLKHWSTIRASVSDLAQGLSSEQMIEIATAIAFGYAYVARLTPEIKALQENFAALETVDPWH